MKIKQSIAFILLILMTLSVVSCGAPEETTAETIHTEPVMTTTALTEGTLSTSAATTAETTVETTVVTVPLLETQQVKPAEEIVLPLDEKKNAVSIEAVPYTETHEIPLLIILANFDADGDGVDDWDPADPGKCHNDKNAPYYGEQWAMTEVTDHYDHYFTGEYCLSEFYYEMTMGKYRYVPAKFDVVPEGSPYEDGIIEVTVPSPHPGATGDQSSAITELFEATDPYINYTKFDTNGDCVMQPTEFALLVLNPGLDEAYGSETFGGREYFKIHGNSQHLYAMMDDVFSFSKVSNVGEYARGGPMQMGTPAHELAHNLGAEDIYDTNYLESKEPEAAGWPLPGNFSLQCSGNHAGGGTRPTYLDPYHRIYLDWMESETVTDGVYTIHDTLSKKEKFLRVNTPDPDEYYLIEIRLKDGFETSLTRGKSKGGIMIWHIDEELCRKHFRKGAANSSRPGLSGKQHDPAIVALFRGGFDEEGRMMATTMPSDPFYYYDPENPSAAVFESGVFHSVLEGNQSLNSYPKDWEGPENFNLRVEVLSEPGHEMTVKITTGRKDFAPKLKAEYADKDHKSITVRGNIISDDRLQVTGCAIAIATNPEFTENYSAMNAKLAEDGKSFTVRFDNLNPETRYYYKAYMVTDRGYAESTGDTTTSVMPKPKDYVTVSMYTAPDARPYEIKVKYGEKLVIPEGWLRMIGRKNLTHDLEGWYLDLAYTEKYDMDAVMQKGDTDFKLYAHWVPKN